MASLPKAVTDLVENFERLPGVGPKSATRLAFYMLNVSDGFANSFADNLRKIKTEVKECGICHSVADNEVCEICNDSKRNHNQIWVVERAIDVLALEKVGNINGVYHVLGGTINPLDHVGPDDLKIFELIERLNKISEEIEVVLAVGSSMEGEATSLYINKKIGDMNRDNIKVTRLGSGLPIGADLEFADSATIQRAIEGRRGM